ncbi:MAG: peptidoglycan-binding lipoprotein, partial [Candidatus Aminicenantes bacterium]|nr:peptidoglycan-binding lipoprotein [Candidatus Aminicenantes bacterium]
MVASRAKEVFFAVLVAMTLLAGCRTAVRTVPPPVPAAPSAPEAAGAPAPAGTALAPLGYSIQVGAFAVYDNARALAWALTDAGLDAFYFQTGSGLFKVRFGDFPSRDAALAEARMMKDR